METYDLQLLPDEVIQKALKAIEIGQGLKVPPPILLHGKAGTGKSSLAQWLGEQLCCEVLTVHCNNSKETNFISSIERFCSSVSLEKLGKQGCSKLVIFDEMENLQRNGEIIRPLLDRFSKQHCWFIGTTNHLEKISDSTKSRFVQISFDDGIDVRQMLLQQQLN
ncbi:hypothetical protein BC476_06030 [Vibrio parahaemolyticus]|uniref:AAA family ATPase n=1 Tax=Vibrio parahaemolyticus TaxID=670 RepID=UPI00083B6634|nr:AAA family ATPase [Vibrio parahaemolyticus]ODA49498.1 hypothetical protein BC476_06030 [Vibrio parahaemolyticus]